MALKKPLILRSDINTIGEIPSTDNIPMMWANPALIQELIRQEMQKLRARGLTGRTMAGSLVIDAFQDPDHIDDALSTYVHDAVNKLVTPIEGGETVVGTADNQGSSSGGYTFFEQHPVPNGYSVTQVSVYLQTGANGCKIKRMTVNGSNFDVTEIQTANLPTGGLNNVNISPAHSIPNTGIHYIGMYVPSPGAVCTSPSGGDGGAYYTGDATGNGVTFTLDSGDHLSIASTQSADSANMVLISNPSTGLFTANWAFGLGLVENYDASLALSVSTATSPSWTSLGTLTKLCAPDPTNSAVELWCSGLVPITGSANRSNRLKIECDYGNNTKIHAAAFQLAA